MLIGIAVTALVVALATRLFGGPGLIASVSAAVVASLIVTLRRDTPAWARVSLGAAAALMTVAVIVTCIEIGAGETLLTVS